MASFRNLSCLLMLVLGTLIVADCNPPSNIVWQRRYDSGQEDDAQAVAADGTDIIVGGYWSDTSGPEVIVDWQILKYDAEGGLLWRRQYDSGKPDWLEDLAVDTDHNIVAAGWSAPKGTDSTASILLVKFSPQGEVIWDRKQLFGLASQGLALCLDRTGILVAGTCFAAADSSDDMLLARFDPEGNLLSWQPVRWESLNVRADESGLDITRDREGNLLIVGEQMLLPEPADSTLTADIVVLKLDAAGKVLWRRIYDSGDDEFLARVVTDSLGNALVWVTSTDELETSVHLLKYSPQGELLQDRLLSGLANAACLGTVIDNTGAVLACGGAGPIDAQSFFGCRFAHSEFSTFLAPGRYNRGRNDVANAMALDRDKSVVLTGVSDPGANADLLLIKLRVPHD